jgi:hypothetical protein
MMLVCESPQIVDLEVPGSRPGGGTIKINALVDKSQFPTMSVVAIWETHGK